MSHMAFRHVGSIARAPTTMARRTRSPIGYANSVATVSGGPLTSREIVSKANAATTAAAPRPVMMPSSHAVSGSLLTSIRISRMMATQASG